MSRAEYRNRNRQRIREAQRRWYANLSAKKKAKRLAYSRAYYRRNKGWISTAKARWSAEWYRNVKARVFLKYGTSCKICGEDNFYTLEIDHINDDGNKDRKLQWAPSRWFVKLDRESKRDDLQTLCERCNKAKARWGPDKSKWPNKLTVKDILNGRKVTYETDKGKTGQAPARPNPILEEAGEAIAT